jgi:hypothetical protein
LRFKGLQSKEPSVTEWPDPLGRTAPLPLEGRFFPLGFALDLRTNAEEICAAGRYLWGEYTPSFETDPLRLAVRVRPGRSPEPGDQPDPSFGLPSYYGEGHLFLTILNQDNFVAWDLDRSFGFVRLTPDVARDYLYTAHFFLEPALTCLAQRYATPIHAACVARDGCGILLAGSSGMGKSSLAWACCRAGLTFVSDDATWVLRQAEMPAVFGKPHRMRFRPEALRLFPELTGVPRYETIRGPRSFEIRTAEVPGFAKASRCRPWRLLFLDRQSEGRPLLGPVSAEEATERLSFNRNSYEPRVWLEQEASLRRLAAGCPAQVLQYSRLEDAVRLITTLP